MFLFKNNYLIKINYYFLLRTDNPFGDLKSYTPSDNRFKENGSIIAVSYEARAKGVTRIMRGGEAKKVRFLILSLKIIPFIVVVFCRNVLKSYWCKYPPLMAKQIYKFIVMQVRIFCKS